MHSSFISSEIHPVISYPIPSDSPNVSSQAELKFFIPRFPSQISETDILSLSGLTLSLVVLPPDTPFHLLSFIDDGMEAVKVLHGSLGWIDQYSGSVVERNAHLNSHSLPSSYSPISSLSSIPSWGHSGGGAAILSMTSMLVDSSEGFVRSGNEGAVFIRFRPSRDLTTDADLRALNVFPSYYSYDVLEHQFIWKDCDRGQSPHNLGNGTRARRGTQPIREGEISIILWKKNRCLNVIFSRRYDWVHGSIFR